MANDATGASRAERQTRSGTTPPEAASRAPTLPDDTVPRLAPGVRLRPDRARDRWVLLAPERVVVLDRVCLDVLERIDGRATLASIVRVLAARYDARMPTIHRDVTELLIELQERGWVELR